MADFIYNGFKEYMADGTVDLDDDAFKMGLLLSTYTPSATHDVWSDISSHEASGTGYTAGGKSLVSVTWTRSGSAVIFDANDIEWTTITITTRYAVIYDTTASNKLVCLFDFAKNKTYVGGTLDIPFHADGIFRLTS
ncbi:hypothetical protein KAR91_34390 [Candidatus Pacearchaeota archaeon]|nr:hypothetical protein [Candidatus Pacearchaeota archaeon]